jgi:AraC-like DNA-binding protein
MAVVRFSTKSIPHAQRRDAVEESYAAHARVDLRFPQEAPIEVGMRFRSLAQVHLAAIETSPHRALRTARHAAAGNDMAAIGITLDGAVGFAQQGCDDVVTGPAGEACLVLFDRPSEGLSAQPAAMLSIAMPRALLAPRLIDFERIVKKGIPWTPALRLLVHYAQALLAEPEEIAPEDAPHLASHVMDLAYLALGARREAAEHAKQRGLRVARLKALKEDITAHLTRGDLTLAMLAARHGISPHYVRALFAAEGTSFTDFVLEERLRLAWTLLRSPRLSSAKISEVAWQAGFSDPSWFNKAFRRRYGMSPGEARLKAGNGDP